MTVMVDELTLWPRARGVFLGGSSHLTATTPAELHEFAYQIGVSRALFVDHPQVQYYDLTPRKREDALRLGAIYISARDQARIRRGDISDEVDPCRCGYCSR